MPGRSRDPRVRSSESSISESPASEALAMMVDALALIDKAGGAEAAGAHLDLAIHRLREWIDAERD